MWDPCFTNSLILDGRNSEQFAPGQPDKILRGCVLTLSGKASDPVRTKATLAAAKARDTGLTRPSAQSVSPGIAPYFSSASSLRQLSN